MTDNFKLIRKMLEFKSEDDFYFIQILQRKKDHKLGKINGTNNNSRLVKAYFVGSLEYFDFIMPEIIELCGVFGARAGINLNRRSYKKMQLQHIKKCTDQLLNGTHNKVYKAYATVVGAFNHDLDKKWILDFDTPIEEINIPYLKEVLWHIQPEGEKEIAIIPSRSGFHFISKPFNLTQMPTVLSDVDIHKNNPTNLYIP